MGLKKNKSHKMSKEASLQLKELKNRKNSIESRCAAAEALGRIGDVAVIEPLIQIIRWEDSEVYNESRVKTIQVEQLRAKGHTMLSGLIKVDKAELHDSIEAEKVVDCCYSALTNLIILTDPAEEYMHSSTCRFCQQEPADYESSYVQPMYKQLPGHSSCDHDAYITMDIVVPRCRKCEARNNLQSSFKWTVPFAGAFASLIIAFVTSLSLVWIVLLPILVFFAILAALTWLPDKYNPWTSFKNENVAKKYPAIQARIRAQDWRLGEPTVTITYEY